jgi:hypothetical protein
MYRLFARDQLNPVREGVTYAEQKTSMPQQFHRDLSGCGAGFRIGVLSHWKRKGASPPVCGAGFRIGVLSQYKGGTNSMKLRKLLLALMLVIISLGGLSGCTPADNGGDGGDGYGTTGTDGE